MSPTETRERSKSFFYRIDFRYRSFDEDLRPSDFKESTLQITVDMAIPEPLERNWISVIRELNPTYFKIEIINVRVSTDAI